MIITWCFEGDWHPRHRLTTVSVPLQPPIPYFDVPGERMLSSPILTPYGLQLQAFK